MTHQWMLPPRPADSLEVNEVADGLVLYDADVAAVHYLNSSAATVFALCDGNRPAELVAEAYREMVPSDAGAADLAWACMDDLYAKRLAR